VRGRPYIGNLGCIEIGEHFCLKSQPVQSHLVTGRKGRLIIGDDVSIDYGAAIAAHGEVTIGKRVCIGPFVMIMDTDFHDVVARDMLPDGGMIVIGDDVRVGSRVTILKGSVIGEGASVLAGSVVASRVPPGATVGGVPARVLHAEIAPAVSAPDLTEGTVTERVRHVMAKTFSLGRLPDPWSGPDAIEAWDSLGTYLLLLDLETEFHLSLAEEEMLEVRNVRDIARMIVRALDRETPTAASPCSI
jgi:acetyltransferase-like isoleucine patch superfamily enzyme/acyl carrier protein